MNKLFKVAITIWGFCGGLLANATSISIYPFTLQFLPANFEYAKDGFQTTKLGSVSHTLPDPFLAEQDVSVKSLRELHNVNGLSIYPTNIAGLGVTLKVGERSVNAEKDEIQYIGKFSQNVTVAGDLVIYDKVASGIYAIDRIQLAGLQFGQDPYLMPIIIEPTTLTVKQKTCEISTERNQNVSLRTVWLSDLVKQREVLGNHFSIGLQCDENVRADVVFFDQNDLQNQREFLTLDSVASTAKGVGVAINRADGSRVRLGEQWTFSVNQVNPIHQFSANYVATGEPISAGSVKAVATVSFTYH